MIMIISESPRLQSNLNCYSSESESESPESHHHDNGPSDVTGTVAGRFARPSAAAGPVPLSGYAPDLRVSQVVRRLGRTVAIQEIRVDPLPS